jgi:hypothetical protein
MTVTTGQFANQSDAQRFAISTLQDWLVKNANRPEVPYQIQLEGNAIRRSNFEGAREVQPPAPGANPSRDARGPMPMGPGGRRGAIGGFEPPRATLSGGGPSNEGGGAVLAAPGGPTDQNAAAAANAVKALAPLSPPVSTETGATTTFTVSWDAVLLPRTPAGGTS